MSPLSCSTSRPHPSSMIVALADVLDGPPVVDAGWT
jgi:CBS-domain-containing membrane protein